MRQINDIQIQEIEKALLQANVPVQIFFGIQNLFKNLPMVKEPKEVKEEV